jgi:hypothetical protein
MKTTSTRRLIARCVCWLLAETLGGILFTHLSWSAAVEDIALMKSADRQKLLVEGAKKEGKVTFYTGLIVDQVVRPLKEGFEKSTLRPSRFLPRQFGKYRTKGARSTSRKTTLTWSAAALRRASGAAGRVHAAILFSSSRRVSRRTKDALGFGQHQCLFP